MFESLQSSLEKTLKTLRGQAKIRASHIEEALSEIKTSLLEADVQFRVVQRFLEQVKKAALGADVLDGMTPYQQFLRILHREMLEVFGSESPLQFSVKPPVVILMVGLQGSGKTTSSAKLGLFLKRKHKRTPLLVSVDVTRPAAIEQLERLAGDGKLDVFKSPSTKALERAQEALRYAQTYGNDTLIVDTAGRLSIDEALMQELAELKKILNPYMVLYVADAMSGQQGLQVAEDFSSRVGLTGVVLSKADADSRGGIAFSIREALKVPLQFVGVGEKLENFEIFHPSRWVSRILGMGDIDTLVEKAEELGRSKEAPKKDQVKRMMKGQFNLLDFQQQMRMISKMGSMSNLMGMIPGMSAMTGKVNPEMIEGRFKRIDAMINSMTKGERENPDIINGERKRRIAKGSGTSVEELNQFLREFYEMQKLMKRFGSGGMKGLGRLFGS